ncbi:peptidylprolyl isomerase [Mariniblastus fucicola]|uniref:peptidylprolyl isomerase n=1 Tax=Mariniblastus fucicola TaxID=980251 RepID=A0A5B9P2J3_9BACT|nr:peptidylprolyl isomerase [Mariniblastus fucicola]QEG20568.1 putative peptidyl-prolyl cis-trans isomerase [Mariniblastus fucicola]
MLFRIGFCLLFAAFCVPEFAVAQTDLASLSESWKACNAKLIETSEALDSGDVSPGLADEYRDLVDEANELIESIRKQALVELKEKPGDGSVFQALVAVMVYDARAGRDGDVLDVGQELIKSKINPLYFEVAAKAGGLELSQKQVFDELVIRHREAMADDLPRVKLETTAGDIVLELYENEAPNTVRNFVSLVESGYYSDKLFHRVIENSIAQGGGYETEGIGSGGPGYQIDCECKQADARRNFTGTIAMANAGRDTGGSQFFLNFKYNRPLDGVHTVFGRVISGADVLDKIERTELTINGMERPIEQAKPDKIVSATVLRKRDHSYRVRKKGEPALPEEPVAEKEDDVPALELEEEAASEPEMKKADASEEEADKEEAGKEEVGKEDVDKGEPSEAKSKKADESESSDDEDQQ